MADLPRCVWLTVICHILPYVIKQCLPLLRQAYKTTMAPRDWPFVRGVRQWPVNSPYKGTQIARFMWPIWDPPGPCRPHIRPTLAPRTLLSANGKCILSHNDFMGFHGHMFWLAQLIAYIFHPWCLTAETSTSSLYRLCRLPNLLSLSNRMVQHPPFLI